MAANIDIGAYQAGGVDIGALQVAAGAGNAYDEGTHTASADGTVAVIGATGYNVYRGVGGLDCVDFSSRVAFVWGPPAELAGLGHLPAARYTYAIRPVLGGLERADLSCIVEFVTDDAGRWIGVRPARPEAVEAGSGPGGRVTVRWSYRTPYGQAEPADFAVYCCDSPQIDPGPADATVEYAGDGQYSCTFILSDGQVCYLAVSARAAGGAESARSAPVGPVVADAAPPVSPQVLLSTSSQ